MPLGDVTYVNAALDALIGSWPASGANYHLFVSDPALETIALDAELTSGGGYTPAAFAPADFAAAAGSSITTTDPVSFGTSTDAYDDVAAWWGIVDTDGLLVYSDDLDTPVAVDEAAVDVSITPTIAFGESD